MQSILVDNNKMLYINYIPFNLISYYKNNLLIPLDMLHHNHLHKMVYIFILLFYNNFYYN